MTSNETAHACQNSYDYCEVREFSISLHFSPYIDLVTLLCESRFEVY